MKTITMQESGQVFEIFTSRKEFADMVKMLDWSVDGQWYDEDSSLTLSYRDGTIANYQYGDAKKPLRLVDVIAGHYSNAGSEAIYNCNLAKNEHYDDYDVVIANPNHRRGCLSGAGQRRGK